MAQHKATRRGSLRSALAHRKLADEILDSINDSQVKFNATMDKLDADTAIALDTDYAATGSVTDVFEADDAETNAQHKATFRKSLRSALAHKRLADEICDALEEIQVAYNTMLIKLDAQAGTLADTDWVTTIGVDVVDSDGAGINAQHKASLRKSLRSALAHRRLADEIMDAFSEIQGSMNASLAALDGGTVNGGHAGFKTSELNPDA